MLTEYSANFFNISLRCTGGGVLSNCCPTSALIVFRLNVWPSSTLATIPFDKSIPSRFSLSFPLYSASGSQSPSVLVPPAHQLLTAAVPGSAASHKHTHSRSLWHYTWSLLHFRLWWKILSLCPLLHNVDHHNICQPNNVGFCDGPILKPDFFFCKQSSRKHDFLILTLAGIGWAAAYNSPLDIILIKQVRCKGKYGQYSGAAAGAHHWATTNTTGTQE